MNEVVSKAQRLKKSQLMKRMGKKIARSRAIKAKRMADAGTLKSRSLKKAREVLFMKLSKGKSKTELNLQQRMAIDKKLEKKGAAVKKLAKKLLPKVKDAEKQRLKSLKQKQE